MSYREAHDHPADVHAAAEGARLRHQGRELLPKAGACGPCPKRTGNAPDLFGDVKGADVCTDPKCFSDKRLAHFAKAAQELEAKGKKVIYGEEAKKAFPGWDSSHDYSRDELSDRYVFRPAATRTSAIASRRARSPGRGLRSDADPASGNREDRRGRHAPGDRRGREEAPARQAPRRRRRGAKPAKPKGPDVDEISPSASRRSSTRRRRRRSRRAGTGSSRSSWSRTLSTRDLEAVALAWGWKANAFRSGSVRRASPAGRGREARRARSRAAHVRHRLRDRAVHARARAQALRHQRAKGPRADHRGAQAGPRRRLSSSRARR
jgi:hypothetical protein